MDAGEATMQTVLMVPLVILVLMMSVQAALWFHTANVAGAAAGEGAAAAAAAHLSDGEASLRGVRAAQDLSGDAHVSLATAPLVAVDARQVVITVRAVVPRVVPFFPSIVTRSALEPREVLINEADR